MGGGGGGGVLSSTPFKFVFVRPRGPPPSTSWKDDMGTGVETLDGRDVRTRLDAIERRTLRALISTAVRDREVLDAKAWKEIKAIGRPAAPQ